MSDPSAQISAVIVEDDEGEGVTVLVAVTAGSTLVEATAIRREGET